MPVAVVIRRESEARRLVALGRALAKTMRKSLRIVSIGDDSELAPEAQIDDQGSVVIDWDACEVGSEGSKAKSPEWWDPVSDDGDPETEARDESFWHVALPSEEDEANPSINGSAVALDALDFLKPDLLIAEKARRPKDAPVEDGGSSAERQEIFAKELFAGARCAVLVVRAGSGQDEGGLCCNRVLVSLPGTGGEHSRRALKIGQGLANHFSCPLVPVHVTPDSDQFSADLGKKIIYRALQGARIKASVEDGVVPCVIISDSIESGLCQAVGDEGETMLLFGAPEVDHLRRHLFGTLPDRVVTDDRGVSIGVVRERRPLDDRLRHAVGKWLRLRVPQLDREARIALFEKLGDDSRWSFDFMTLICLSTAIAGLGLIQNSPAVVIGAMLVAPLMVPLLGSGLALVQGNLPLIRRAALAVVLGFISALGIGFLLGFVARWVSGITPEMAARGGPSLLDMGVAFVSGIAASYCIARPRLSSALAGVAIAAALVPPIATVGMALNMAEFQVARGAALLFGTNVVAIILGAALNFLIAGIRGSDRVSRGRLWSRRIMAALVVCLAALCLPLGSAILERVIDPDGARLTSLIDGGLERQIESQVGDLKVDSIAWHAASGSTDRSPTLEVILAGPNPPEKQVTEKVAAVVRTSGGVPAKTDVVIRYRRLWHYKPPVKKQAVQPTAP